MSASDAGLPNPGLYGDAECRRMAIMADTARIRHAGRTYYHRALDGRVSREAGSGGTSKRGAGEEEKRMTSAFKSPHTGPTRRLGLVATSVRQPPIVEDQKRDTGEPPEEAYRGRPRRRAPMPAARNYSPRVGWSRAGCLGGG
jgi:hypothetical protein